MNKYINHIFAVTAFAFPMHSFSAGKVIDVPSDSSARYVVISHEKHAEIAEARIMVTRGSVATYDTVKYDCDRFTFSYGKSDTNKPIIPESPDYFIANTICQSN